MYRGYSGMGRLGLDWGGILNTGIQTGGNILTSIFGGGSTTPGSSINPNYPAGYPGTYVAPETGISTTDLLSYAAIGVGGYLLLKTLTKRRRR